MAAEISGRKIGRKFFWSADVNFSIKLSLPIKDFWFKVTEKVLEVFKVCKSKSPKTVFAPPPLKWTYPTRQGLSGMNDLLWFLSKMWYLKSKRSIEISGLGFYDEVLLGELFQIWTKTSKSGSWLDLNGWSPSPALWKIHKKNFKKWNFWKLLQLFDPPIFFHKPNKFCPSNITLKWLSWKSKFCEKTRHKAAASWVLPDACKKVPKSFSKATALWQLSEATA